MQLLFNRLAAPAALPWSALAAWFAAAASRRRRAREVAQATLEGFECADDAPCPYAERRLVEAFWRGREEGRWSDDRVW